MQHDPPTKPDEPTDDVANRVTNRDRGVSEIIGAILLFGLLIAVLVLIQANAVPDANKQLEFQHNERVHGDFVDLDADLATTAETGNGRVTVVETGLRYPPRFFLFNPPPAEGAVRTNASNFTIRNAVAQDNTETADYWNGDDTNADRFVYESRSVRYDPAYNVYAGAPVTTYTHGAVVNEFEDGTVRPVDSAAFVNGRTISLIALDGDRDVSQVDPLSVEAAPLSTNTRTVRVTNTTDSPIVIRVETTLSAAEWNELLADESTAEGGNVVSVTDVAGADAVDVELQQGVTYELRLAKLGVGPGATDPEPAYVTSVTPTRILANQTQPLTVEVRDAFNGPEAGVPVTFKTPDGTETIVPTNSEGRATLRYSPDTVGEVVTARADLDAATSVAPQEEVVFTVSDSADGSGVGNELNPVTERRLQFENATAVGITQSPSTNRIEVVFSNPGMSDVEISKMRMNFYFVGGQGEIPGPAYANVTSLGGESLDPPTRLDIRGGFTSVPWTVGAGTSDARVVLELYEEDGTPYDSNNLDRDFFVFTVEHPDGSISSYIISPQSGVN